LAAAAAVAVLASAAGRALRVRDRSRTALAHALLAQALVLLVVLHARTVVLSHIGSPPWVACSSFVYPAPQRHTRLLDERLGGGPAPQRVEPPALTVAYSRWQANLRASGLHTGVLKADLTLE